MRIDARAGLSAENAKIAAEFMMRKTQWQLAQLDRTNENH